MGKSIILPLPFEQEFPQILLTNLKGDREARAMVQRQMDVDILVTGHTHVFESYEYQVWWNAKTSTD
jgi:predicted phosphodiesterase